MKPTRNFCLPLLAACLCLNAAPANAWGRQGHAAVATIAQAYLTPAAQRRVRALLHDDRDAHGKPSGRASLPDIASWADEIRQVAPENTYRGWHSRGNPICSDRLGGCRAGECADQKLLHYATVLKNSAATHRERNEALKWVVHLVGDLHTPLHSGSNHDRSGQMPAALEGRQNRPGATLHSLWDHDLLRAALKNHALTVTRPPGSKLPPGAITQWMRETREVSRKHVYDPLPGFACGSPTPSPIVLDRAYQQQALPVIRLQIERAGLRLAQLLNELLE